MRFPPENFHHERSPDIMVQHIKSAVDSHELLDLMVTANRKETEPQQIAQALARLLSLQKNGYNSLNPSQLVKHSGFNNMCQLLKVTAHRMEINEVVESLKALTYFGLNSDTIIVTRLLSCIKDQINDLSLNNLVFLSFLLTKLNRTPLIEALQIAIPMIFNMNITQQLDHNNTTELAELLHFATCSPIQIKQKSMNIIITALTLHGNELDLSEAKSIVWSFGAMRNFDPSYLKLFNNCMNILVSKNMEMSFEDIETTLDKFIEKFQNGDYIYLHEEFFNACTATIIEKDLGFLNASYVLRKFNRINYVNYNLLDYIDRCILSNHSNLSSTKPTGLISFATAFSNANYKTENWEIVKSLLHENPLIHSHRTDLPWIKLTVELMSLGFTSKLLLEKVFNSKFLETVLRRENNRLDYNQLLLLWQAVTLLHPDYDGPLPEQRFIDDAILLGLARNPNEAVMNTLADAFGGKEFVQTNVATTYGHCLDFVISFDNNENPIAMPCKIKMYDEIPKSQVKSVAVFFQGRSCSPVNFPGKLRGIFELRMRTIKQLGISSVNISTSIWNNLQESERMDYLKREVRYGLR